MHSKSGRLEATPPFDFEKSMRFLSGFSPLGGEQQISNGILMKAVMVDGQTVVFKLSAEKNDDSAGLYYELLSEVPLSEAIASQLAERVSFFLSLSDDLNPFYEIAAKKDPKYFPIVKKFVGLHHVKFPSLFETTCWAILAQRSQMSVAKRAKNALTENFGGMLKVDDTVYHAFPDYQTFRTAKVRDILAATKNRRSTERLSSLLSSFEDLDEDFLRSAPYEKAEERLKRIKGIGDWSSQFILFRGLGRIKKLHSNMGPAIKMMEDLYGPGMTLDEVNKTYGKYCGYWSIYLRAANMSARELEVQRRDSG